METRLLEGFPSCRPPSSALKGLQVLAVALALWMQGPGRVQHQACRERTKQPQPSAVSVAFFRTGGEAVPSSLLACLQVPQVCNSSRVA